MHYLREALDLYVHYVRDPISQAVGFTGRFSQIVLDVGVLWISTFMAVNAFIYQVDGTFVWGHVGRNYCFRSSQSRWAQMLCRAPKLMWAFLMTPIVCLVSVYAALRTGRSHLTMAFVTVNPKAVAKYLLVLVAIPTILIGLAVLVFKAFDSA